MTQTIYRLRKLVNKGSFFNRYPEFQGYIAEPSRIPPLTNILFSSTSLVNRDSLICFFANVPKTVCSSHRCFTCYGRPCIQLPAVAFAFISVLINKWHAKRNELEIVSVGLLCLLGGDEVFTSFVIIAQLAQLLKLNLVNHIGDIFYLR